MTPHMRQCPTCGRIYPKALGRGVYCSTDCEDAEVRRIRSYVRLRRLARMVKADEIETDVTRSISRPV